MRTSFAAAITALFAGASAQNYYSNFEISDFTATVNNYYFNVELAPGYSTSCSYNVGNSYDYLSAVPYTTCADSSVAFEVARPSQSGPATLYVYNDYSATDAYTGSYSIPANQIQYNNYGNTVIQQYNGPTAFDITINNYKK